MSDPNSHEWPQTPDELASSFDVLEGAAEADMQAILAEAQSLESFEGEERAMATLLERMQADSRAAGGRSNWGGLIPGLIGLLAVAGLFFLVQGGAFSSNELERQPASEGIELDGGQGVQDLQPAGAIESYAGFSWEPAGSIELSATLRIWDASADPSQAQPLEWKGITDDELPFQPDVELPESIRWEVFIEDVQGREVRRSKSCFAHFSS